MTNLLFTLLFPGLQLIHLLIYVHLHFSSLKRYFSKKVDWWIFANLIVSMNSCSLVIELCELPLSLSRISLRFVSLRNLLFSQICLFVGLCFFIADFLECLILWEFLFWGYSFCCLKLLGCIFMKSWQQCLVVTFTIRWDRLKHSYLHLIGYSYCD